MDNSTSATQTSPAQTGRTVSTTPARRPIIFKTAQLGNFVVVKEPMDKVIVEVLNNVTEKNLVAGLDGRPHYIVTVKAITEDKLDLAIERFKDKHEVSVEETNGLFATFNIWKNDNERPALPMKGEKINVAFGFVDNKDKTAQVLRIVGHSLNPAMTNAPKFNLELIGQVPAAAAIPSTEGVRENEIAR